MVFGGYEFKFSVKLIFLFTVSRKHALGRIGHFENFRRSFRN